MDRFTKLAERLGELRAIRSELQDFSTSGLFDSFEKSKEARLQIDAEAERVLDEFLAPETLHPVPQEQPCYILFNGWQAVRFDSLTPLFEQLDKMEWLSPDAIGKTRVALPLAETGVVYNIMNTGGDYVHGTGCCVLVADPTWLK